MPKFLWSVISVAFAAVVFGAQTPMAELLIVNARIFTGNDAQPWAEALLSREDRIVVVGTDAEVRAKASASAQVVDADGRLLIPGINDAHTHPGASPPTIQVDAPPATQEDPSLDLVLERLRATISKHPGSEWVRADIGGRVLEDPRATREVLDRLTGARPVMLASGHGHGLILNSAAMRLLEIGERDPDPPGGFYGRAADGRTLTGLAHEYADYRIRRRYAMLADDASRLAVYRDFARQSAAFGITTAQAMLTTGAAEVFASADLPIRIRLIDFPLSATREWRPPSGPRQSPRIYASGTKWILDGTPIERLMRLREPYTDAPSTRGRLNLAPDELRSVLSAALAAGEQPLFHAVGDAAIDDLLAALEATGGEQWRPLRPRIEHGDMMEPAHFAPAKRLGVVLVQNPAHFMSGPLFRARVGGRIARSTLVKSALDAGVPLAIGSDGPLNPFLNIMFATINDVNPKEALSVEQAVRAYTRGAAFAELADGWKGTLEPGKLADFAVLSQDVFKIPPGELPKTASVLTVVGGRIVHAAK